MPANRFDPSADAVVAVMRYGLGMPHHRLAQWQRWSGVPLPASTQFERMEVLANVVHGVKRVLDVLAANQPLVFGDDTGVRILEWQPAKGEHTPGERTGTYTSGFVARGLEAEQPTVVLYASGRRHAGENLDRLLEQRAAGLADVIHMADAAARNPRYTRRVPARCLTHARRNFTRRPK